MDMKLYNARLGFANNSSSSHSLLFLPGTSDDFAEADGRVEFGWGGFTLASPKAKLSYLATAIYPQYVKKEEMLAVRGKW
jgi:hypothetical protein